MMIVKAIGVSSSENMAPFPIAIFDYTFPPVIYGISPLVYGMKYGLYIDYKPLPIPMFDFTLQGKSISTYYPLVSQLICYWNT